jgi:hypothetical protein
MNSRRSFVKIAMALVGATVVLPQLLSAQEKRRAKPAAGGAGGDLALPLVEPGKGMAASVNYQNDHSAVKEAALKVDRSGVKFADQHCGKCMLYSKVGNKDGGEVGKCTLFAGQLVKSNSWCSSWSKKS